jgi:hypothetical protein
MEIRSAIQEDRAMQARMHTSFHYLWCLPGLHGLRIPEGQTWCTYFKPCC